MGPNRSSEFYISLICLKLKNESSGTEPLCSTKSLLLQSVMQGWYRTQLGFPRELKALDSVQGPELCSKELFYCASSSSCARGLQPLHDKRCPDLALTYIKKNIIFTYVLLRDKNNEITSHIWLKGHQISQIRTLPKGVLMM